MKKEEENNLKVYQEENKELEENIINNKGKSYIIAEINIDAYNIYEEISLINSFEQIIREDINLFYDIKKEEYYKYENEKEIKDNCQIEINNKKKNFHIIINLKKKVNILLNIYF